MTKAGPLKGRAARLARLMPSGPNTAARTPFVLLVVLLLGGGLIGLLLLNTSLSQGSFKLIELKKKTTELTDEEQALQRDVDARSAPDALERRARELGMVPGGGPAFLEPDGTVRGVPSRAPAAPSTEPSPTQEQAQGAGQDQVQGREASPATDPEPAPNPSPAGGTAPTPRPTPAPTAAPTSSALPAGSPSATASPAPSTPAPAPTTPGR